MDFEEMGKKIEELYKNIPKEEEQVKQKPVADPEVNYMSVIQQTREEKIAMYMKECTKEQLAGMLAECNRILESIGPKVVTPDSDQEELWREKYEAIEPAVDAFAQHIDKMAEAAEELIHLHSCEQEGLSSGQPTPQQWIYAVDKLQKLISRKPQQE